MMQQQANAENARLQSQLRANQARLQQTLAQNSRDMSNMIMDSWNKKMESDSRISQNYHEAIMGVNTYVRTDGSTVDHSGIRPCIREPLRRYRGILRRRSRPDARMDGAGEEG